MVRKIGINMAKWVSKRSAGFYLFAPQIGGPQSTEVAFVRFTQRPRVRILALSIFYCLVEIESI